MFKNPFERRKTPESSEKKIIKIAAKELSNGVNGPSIYLAFNAAQKENQVRKLGLANNYLLNIVKDVALSMSDTIEDSMYGGSDQTFANIDTEIKKLRERLTDEEKRT